MNERLAHALIAEWNGFVMVALGNDLMLSDCLTVYGDPSAPWRTSTWLP